MITTAQLSAKLGINQRAIQKRIARLGLTPQKIGSLFILTDKEAKKVRQAKNTPGPEPNKKGQRL